MYLREGSILNDNQGSILSYNLHVEPKEEKSFEGAVAFFKVWFRHCEDGNLCLRFLNDANTPSHEKQLPKNVFLDIKKVDDIPDILREHETQDSYFACALRKGHDATKEGVTLIPGVWYEHDNVTPEKADRIRNSPCPPSIIVQSSLPTKWQVYYVFKEPLGKDGISQAEDLITKLLHFLGRA